MCPQKSQSSFNYSFFFSLSLLFLERQSCYRRISFSFFSFCLAPCRRPSCVDLVANKSMNKLQLCLFPFSISFNLSICFGVPILCLSLSFYLCFVCLKHLVFSNRGRSITLSRSFFYSLFRPPSMLLLCYSKRVGSEEVRRRGRGKGGGYSISLEQIIKCCSQSRHRLFFLSLL